MMQLCSMTPAIRSAYYQYPLDVFQASESGVELRVICLTGAILSFFYLQEFIAACSHAD